MEDILRPTATYLQTDEAFKEVVGEILGETVSLQPEEEEPIDMTRQFTPEEVAELQARIEAGNKRISEFESQQNQQTEEVTSMKSQLIEATATRGRCK